MRLLVLDPSGPDPEGEAAAEWGRAYGHEVRVCSLGDAPPATLERDVVAWCHAGTAVPDLDPGWRALLASWLAAGGQLLLGALATPLARQLGGPDESPEIEGPRPWRHESDPAWPADFRDWPDYPHIRGAHGWGRQALFDGLQRGTYTWTATEGESVAHAVFRQPRWPQGRVLAVERAYVQLDTGTAVAWEYDVGRGRLLCLGAHVILRSRNHRLDPQRDRYLANALALLDSPRTGPAVPAECWPRARQATGRPTARGTPASRNPAPVPVALDASTGFPLAGLALRGVARPGAPFTIAGQRALVVGDEGTGVAEGWIHPVCVMQSLQPRFGGTPLVATAVTVTPGAVERQLRDAAGASWREVVAVPFLDAGIVYELSAWERDGAPVSSPQSSHDSLPASSRPRAPESPADAVLSLVLTMQPRLQWPLPADALLPLEVSDAREGERLACVVRGSDGVTEVRVAVDGAATVAVDHDGPHVRLTASARPGQALRLAVFATQGDGANGGAAWSPATPTLLADTLRDRGVRDRQLHASTVRLATPAPGFDAAWQWAKARLASCIVSVPGIGTGMVAGFAASRPGWGASRPGYAWFFGRDACWCVDALLAAGMFDEAHAALAFLASTADVTGKVIHELTTSGVAHYDAADSTPLWLRAVARYASWTGDMPSVRAWWPQVRAAIAFTAACDLDGDGLPENEGVGHGWIESGPLGGGRVTSYVAAIWIDALRGIEPLATRLGDHELAARVAALHARALDAFEARLRDPTTGRVALQLSTDGRAVHDLTALAAVPILLGVDTHPVTRAMLDTLTGPTFCAPWGVRLLGRDDARYRPRGYHVGAVWPLFTGWTAWAAFATGRGDDGWRLASMVAECAGARQRGAFDEVLDGDDGSGAGVCPDQGWSAAMVIAPVICGMLGLRPDAARRACVLEPRWPASWPKAMVSGLRIGASRFGVAMERSGVIDAAGSAPATLSLTLESGPPLSVRVVQAAGEQVVELRAGAPVVVSDGRSAPGGDRGPR